MVYGTRRARKRGFFFLLLFIFILDENEKKNDRLSLRARRLSFYHLSVSDFLRYFAVSLGKQLVCDGKEVEISWLVGLNVMTKMSRVRSCQVCVRVSKITKTQDVTIHILMMITNSVDDYYYSVDETTLSNRRLSLSFLLALAITTFTTQHGNCRKVKYMSYSQKHECHGLINQCLPIANVLFGGNE